MNPSVDQLEQELDGLLKEAREDLARSNEQSEIAKLGVKYLGRKKGLLNAYFAHLGREGWSPEEKARLGQKLNAVKTQLEEVIVARLQQTGSSSTAKHIQSDFTLPGHSPSVGRLHPISQTINEIVGIFCAIGFAVVEGFEVETEYYNFDALNIPPEHPSRYENFDTFYLKKGSAQEGVSKKEAKGPYLLRSHTSPMQVRFMERHQPPFQIVVPGRVFRPDAVDASHCFQFHQVEGLTVGPDITFGDLKGILAVWARSMFGADARLRFRPHYFPFTEPSAEADVSCIFCRGKGCRVCGQKGWLEILGCGMVHPAVFKSVGYMPSTVGFAFGLGVERIAMLKYGIEDIRLFFENDLRFLQQFP